MNKMLPVLLVIIIGIVAYYLIQPKINPESSQQNTAVTPNKSNCLTDDCLQVENLNYPVSQLPQGVQETLDKAIEDEYKAQATYQKVIDKLGSIRPFAMIIGAEGQHIASLKAIYDKYGVKTPENTWPSKVSSPATLQEACQVGVEAEIANAKLYQDELLPVVKNYEDITLVFTNLMNASEQKHLPAFQRCSGK